MFNLQQQQQYEDRYGNEIKRQRLDDDGNHLKVWRMCEYKYGLPEQEQDEDEVQEVQEQVQEVQQVQQDEEEVQEVVPPQQNEVPEAPMHVIGRTVIIYTAQDTTVRGVIHQLFDLNGERAIQIQTNQGENLIFTSSQMYGVEVLLNPSEEALSPIQRHEVQRHEVQRHEVVQIDDDEDDEVVQIVQIDDASTEQDQDQDQDDFPDVEFMPARREEEQQTCCAICFDITDAARNFVSLDCGHQFHFACIMGNMANGGQNRNQCPMCRSTVVQHYNVHNESNMEEAEEVVARLAHSNQILQGELDQNRQHRAALTEEYVRVMTMNLQINTRHREEREARDALERRAQICVLNERIAQVVQNAANNDIRQNYEHGARVHMERQIRDLCMSFGMMAYDAQYDQAHQDQAQDLGQGYMEVD